MSVEEKLKRLLDQNVFTASWSADAKRLMVGWVTEIFNESRPCGEWTRCLDNSKHWVWKCKCGWTERIATNFCPDCGADMRDKKDDLAEIVEAVQSMKECEAFKTEAKKCPNCGSDLHEYCFMCGYEGEEGEVE